MYKKAVLPAGCYNTDLQHVPRVWFIPPGKKKKEKKRGSWDCAAVAPKRGPRTHIPHYQPWLERWWENTPIHRREPYPGCQTAWKVSTAIFWRESRHYLCFLKRCCVGYEIWACSDQIQLSPPLLLSTQPLPLHSPGFHQCLCLYSNKRQRRRQQFLFSLPLIGPWLRTKSTFKLQHTLNNVISNTRSKNKMTRCPNMH